MGSKTCKFVKYLLVSFFVISAIVLIIIVSISLNEIRTTNSNVKKCGRISREIIHSQNGARSLTGSALGGGDSASFEISPEKFYLREPYNILLLSSDSSFTDIIKKWKSSVEMLLKNKKLDKKIKKKGKAEEEIKKASGHSFDEYLFNGDEAETSKNILKATSDLEDEFSPIVLHSTCQTRAGFISSLKSEETRLYLGTGNLVKYDLLKMEIENKNSILYPLPYESRIFNLGKTSSCILKRKIPDTPSINKIKLEDLCSLSTNPIAEMNGIDFVRPNRGEGPSIHFEQACSSIKKTLTDPKKNDAVVDGKSNVKIYPYKQDIHQSIRVKPKNGLEEVQEHNNFDFTNQIYLTSLSFYIENKNHFEEIKVNDVSCTSPDAPLSSDLFLFVNDFTHKNALEFCSLLSTTIQQQHSEISKQRMGLVKYNVDWLSDNNNFYPLLSE